MAAVLIIQNSIGTVADANAYNELAYLKQYWDNHGYDWSGYDDDQITVAEIVATTYMDGRFTYIGERSQKDQDTAWPRQNAYDRDDYLIDGIPKPVNRANAEYTFIALTADLNPTPTRDETGARIIQHSESVGPISESKTYASGASFTQPEYPKADQILLSAGLVMNSNRIIRG